MYCITEDTDTIGKYSSDHFNYRKSKIKKKGSLNSLMSIFLTTRMSHNNFSLGYNTVITSTFFATPCINDSSLSVSILITALLILLFKFLFCSMDNDFDVTN